MTAAEERKQSSHLAPQDERKAGAGRQSFRGTRTSSLAKPQTYFDRAVSRLGFAGAGPECLRRSADGWVIVEGWASGTSSSSRRSEMATMLRQSGGGWFAKRGLGDEPFVRCACHDTKTSANERKQSSHLAPQDERKTCAGIQSFRVMRTSGMAE